MDTYVFGPKVWGVVTDALREQQLRSMPAAATLVEPVTELSQSRSVESQPCKAERAYERLLAQDGVAGCPDYADLIRLLYALRMVLPCMWCRASYRRYLLAEPPERAANIAEWLWGLHEMVNQKLGRRGVRVAGNTCEACARQVLPLSKYRKRLVAWRAFSSDEDIWDVLGLIAANYATALEQDAAQKRAAHIAFIRALRALLLRVPHLAAAARFLRFRAVDFVNQRTLLEAIARQRNAWAATAHRPREPAAALNVRMSMVRADNRALDLPERPTR